MTIRAGVLAALLAGAALGASEEKPDTTRLAAARMATETLPGSARVSEGVAVTETHYFGTDNRGGESILHRFDHDWKLLESQSLPLPGVDRIGAISHHDGFLWAGFLNTRGPRKAVVARIDVRDLRITATYDITQEVSWIDPVCFDGTHLWVGDMSDMGIHRYRIAGDRLEHAGVLRYPKNLHFSQGIQVRGTKLYSIHTFGSWSGLAEFDIDAFSGEQTLRPRRFWRLSGNGAHLAGFDFVPGQSGEIWHAEGPQVQRFHLTGF